MGVIPEYVWLFQGLLSSTTATTLKDLRCFRLSAKERCLDLPWKTFRELSAEPSAKTFRGTFRKNLPQNLPQNTFWMKKGRAEGPEPSGILPESFRKPSADKPFTKTFRKNIPRNLPQKPSMHVRPSASVRPRSSVRVRPAIRVCPSASVRPRPSVRPSVPVEIQILVRAILIQHQTTPPH